MNKLIKTRRRFDRRLNRTIHRIAWESPKLPEGSRGHTHLNNPCLHLLNGDTLVCLCPTHKRPAEVKFKVCFDTQAQAKCAARMLREELLRVAKPGDAVPRFDAYKCPTGCDYWHFGTNYRLAPQIVGEQRKSKRAG